MRVCRKSMTHSHYNKNMIDIENFSKSNKLFDGHYQLLRPLSTDGGTADVWLAIDVNTVDVSVEEDEKSIDQDTGMLVAIKIYRPKNALDIDGEAFTQLEQLYNQKQHITGVPTGFADLDYITAGLHKSDLVIVAARPAMGKSALDRKSTRLNSSHTS